VKQGLAAGCAFALGVGAASHSLAADGELRLGAGLDYTQGKYGTSTETKVLAVPVTARYEVERWTYKLTLPYLKVDGPANFLPGFGPVNNSGKPKRRNFAGTTTESGLGDAVLSATYNVWYDRSLERGMDLTGRVKLPTGDAARGLGTGSTDLSLQVDAWRTFNRTTLFADVGYTFFGHSDYVELQNAANFGVGASQKLNDLDSVGASVDGRERASPGGFPQRELTLFWNRRADRLTRFQAYVLFGFADGSPDFGIGVSASRVF
jgi:hypothetical protein